MRFPLFRIVAHVLGIVGMALLPPVAASLWYSEGPRAVAAFAGTALACVLLAALFRLKRSRDAVPIKTSWAFFIVGGVWIGVCLVGAVPLWASGAFGAFTDAVFESISGFTTTGASVCAGVEALPHSVNLWRCETHWLGGMGVIALAVALVPLLGIGGFRLIKAETSGPEKGRMTPRIASTAKALWLIYIALTASQAVLLRLAGLGWFDAVCHAFSTLGTGGFSTMDASVGAFGNPAAEWICTVFMLLASVNFALYYRLLSGKVEEVLKDTELRTFAGIVIVAVLSVTLVERSELGEFADSLRASAFQVASVLSTTGFMTSDYASWRPAAQMLLFVLFMVGGCSGSTAGGVKVIRWAVLGKQLRNECRRITHPREVTTIRINGISGRDDIVPLVAAFVTLYAFVVLVTAIAGALAGLGLTEALSCALSMVGNIGPAFGACGPSANYGAMPAALKWWYSFAMIAGRLEIFTMLILAGRLLALLVAPARSLRFRPAKPGLKGAALLAAVAGAVATTHLTKGDAEMKDTVYQFAVKDRTGGEVESAIEAELAK